MKSILRVVKELRFFFSDGQAKGSISGAGYRKNADFDSVVSSNASFTNLIHSNT